MIIDLLLSAFFGRAVAWLPFKNNQDRLTATGFTCFFLFICAIRLLQWTKVVFTCYRIDVGIYLFFLFACRLKQPASLSSWWRNELKAESQKILTFPFISASENHCDYKRTFILFFCYIRKRERILIKINRKQAVNRNHKWQHNGH